MMKLGTTPAGQCLLLIWRTEFLFYTPERRRLADEWNQVRLTSLPLPERSNLINDTLDRALPFPDSSFDGIYSFHSIEHLDPNVGERLVADLYRLLKPNGICRISTLNLEFHATEYLSCLRKQAASASAAHYADYQWALCNLVDQLGRTVSGGKMWDLIGRGAVRPEYVKEQNGDLLEFLYAPPESAEAVQPKNWRTQLQRAVANPRLVLNKLAWLTGRWFRRPSPAPSYLELSHERNLWFYDRLSLGRLFSAAGFQDIEVKDYRASSIPDWRRYDFDRSVHGDYPLEPSLYMEGIKPAGPA